jgi:ferritin-like metal-binding protein YciE
METVHDRVVRYLDDAWAVEKALVGTLQDMANEVDLPEVRQMFLEHSDLTHQQEEELEARIRALGEEPSGSKGWFNSFMGKIGDMMQGAHDSYDKTTQDVVKAFAVENFEMGMYQALESFANAVGDTETAQLARRIFEQESNTASRIWPHIASCAARAVQATGTPVEERAA